MTRQGGPKDRVKEGLDKVVKRCRIRNINNETRCQRWT
ncbi:hypothetical protein PssvBMR2_gp02 [Pseudomonas phage MR2]|uniref:Uncharacterized protein n=1 Tax=Pseudomonas phage MR2 TaxID=2711170 RepID=A0A6M3TCK2_9CAUD|nr:hypothetical protein PssvBMR2_gp02 [Pseudomonas phage MR2]